MGRVILIALGLALILVGLIAGIGRWSHLRVSSDRKALESAMNCISRRTRNQLASINIVKSCDNRLQLSVHLEGKRRVEHVYLREGYPKPFSSKGLMLYRSTLGGEGDLDFD